MPSPKDKFSAFNRFFFDSSHPATFIGTGSSGGKAQSLQRTNEILASQFNNADFPQIKVNIPTFTVIRTDIFDAFMKSNNLYEISLSQQSDERISHAFQKADLPFNILGDLRALVNEVHTPLAVRSSSLLEDAMYEPFAGIYGTKMTPNNQPDADTRFRKLVEAIKFVYASTFFRTAKNYISATRHRIEDEKMAVIIQEVVGQRHENNFYPQLSGVARSYNFYSTGRALPKDGVVNLALGMGKTIVDGGVVWSYSPAYPNISPPFASYNDMLKNTQIEFWTVNVGKPPGYDPINETEFMKQENIAVADKDGSLAHIASTLDNYSGRLSMGTGVRGARILNFAPLLQLDEIPFNTLIKTLLSLCEKSLNAPVEIEFAMTFNSGKQACIKHRFGFLQVRPMVVSSEKIEITHEEMTSPDILIAATDTLGNGVQDNIHDVLFVIPENFEAKYTTQIVTEIDRINKRLVAENRPYLLIGFGRWGSSDPWLGIPVNWSNVSGVKAIVESTLEKMNVELSQGSHFFHNLTSFGVFYFSVPFTGTHKIDWNWLQRQNTVEKTRHIHHVRIPSPLVIKVDGRSRRGIILKPEIKSHG